MIEYRAIMKHKHLHPDQWIHISNVRTYHTLEGAQRAIEQALKRDPNIIETKIEYREVTPWIKAGAQ